MTLDEIVAGFKVNSVGTKMKMFEAAFAVVLRDTEFGKADITAGQCEFDINSINFSEYCAILGWPDFQDGGVFEQIIEKACIVACEIYGYKARYAK